MIWLQKFSKDPEAFAILRGGVLLSIALLLAVLAFAVWVPDRGEFKNLDKVGSFLQGTFAPIAFFWLVIAVFLQTKELGLQREELSLNREELRKSVEQFQAQTKIMMEEQQAQKQLLHESTFDNRLVKWALGFHSLCAALQGQHTRITIDSRNTSDFDFARVQPDRILKLCCSQSLTELFEAIDALVNGFIQHMNDQRLEITNPKLGLDTFFSSMDVLVTQGRQLIAEAHTSQNPQLLVTVRRAKIENIVYQTHQAAEIIRANPKVVSTWQEGFANR